MSDKSFTIQQADWTAPRRISIAIARNLVGPAASRTITGPFVPPGFVRYRVAYSPCLPRDPEETSLCLPPDDNLISPAFHCLPAYDCPRFKSSSPDGKIQTSWLNCVVEANVSSLIQNGSVHKMASRVPKLQLSKINVR